MIIEEARPRATGLKPGTRQALGAAVEPLLARTGLPKAARAEDLPTPKRRFVGLTRFGGICPPNRSSRTARRSGRVGADDRRAVTWSIGPRDSFAVPALQRCLA